MRGKVIRTVPHRVSKGPLQDAGVAALGKLVGAAAAARRRGGQLGLLATGDRMRQRLTDTRVDRIIDVVHTIVTT